MAAPRPPGSASWGVPQTKVLVTGGAGFIGSHVVELLLAAGAEVRVLDRCATGVPAGADLIHADLTNPQAVLAAVAGVDAVCHQAAKVGLGVDFADVTGYATDNDLGTAVLLGALWKRSFRGRFVLASSMVVYGEGRSECPEHGPVRPRPRQPEDLASGRFDPRCPHAGCAEVVSWASVTEDAPMDPRNTYAATKLHQEHLCGLWGREAGADVVSLRYHNVYGPRMPRDTPYAGVAAIFRSELAAGRPPQVFEDGGQTRDFVHVGDVARANLLALTAAPVAAGAYNVGSGVPRTVADLAVAMSDAFGAGAPRPHITGEWRMGDVRHIVASSRKAEERLGFAAEITLAEGLATFAREEPSTGAPAETTAETTTT